MIKARIIWIEFVNQITFNFEPSQLGPNREKKVSNLTLDGRPKIYPKSENIQILLPLMTSQMLLKGIWCISQKSLSGAHLSSSMINGPDHKANGLIKNVRNHIYPISIQQPYSIAPQSQMESLIQRIAFVICGPHSGGALDQIHDLL